MLTNANITQVSFHLKVLQPLLNKCNKSTWRHQISINGAFVNTSLISKSKSSMCETCSFDMTQVVSKPISCMLYSHFINMESFIQMERSTFDCLVNKLHVIKSTRRSFPTLKDATVYIIPLRKEHQCILLHDYLYKITSQIFQKCEIPINIYISRKYKLETIIEDSSNQYCQQPTLLKAYDVRQRHVFGFIFNMPLT